MLIARAPEGLNELVSAFNRVRELLPVDFEPSYFTMVPNTARYCGSAHRTACGA